MYFLPIIIINWVIDHTVGLFITSKEKKEELYFKQKTYNPKTGTYLDSKCRERLYSDDSFVFIRRNRYGETEIKYQNGVVRNLAQEKYDREPGSVTQLAGYDLHNKNHYFTKAIGYRYKDRTNGKIYVIRNLKYDGNYFLFYMDANSGMIIRPTDGQLKIEEEAKKQNRKYYDDDYFKKAIDYFNNNIKTSYPELFYRNKENSIDPDTPHIQYRANSRKEI